MIPRSVQRSFLPQDFKVTDWQELQPYFDNLISRELATLNDLMSWLKDRSELEAILNEDLGWRYIRMTCDTTNVDYKNAYEYFVTNIEPKADLLFNELNKKLVACSSAGELEKDRAYFIYLRGIKKEIALFKEENIPLKTEISIQSQQYGRIVGAMTIEFDGKELTLQQAAKYLKDNDRKVREDIFKKITVRRIVDRDNLNDLYTQLINKRTQLAQNAGFKNFRDYMFEALGRFDYTIRDCFDFHEAIASEITPLIDVLDLKRKSALKLDTLKPWDLEVDTTGKAPLKPFDDPDELIAKTITCFGRIDSSFGEYIALLRDSGNLDLASRKGKAPGGYNYPLYESGVPFIFMNAVGTLTDLITMMHEGGHAVHSFLCRHLPITAFKNVPSEVAELASMGMELISMEHWDVFFPNPDDLKRARREQLEKVLRTLPWVATIDKFQHWVYENPNHTVAERKDAWVKIMREFGSQIIDWSDVEDAFENNWQKQLHLFEVPFYYIEYGMAQLGAIALWRNYKSNPTKTLEQFKQCLSLGYTRSIPELYKAAGIEFNFSKNYVSGLAEFIKAELKKLD